MVAVPKDISKQNDHVGEKGLKGGSEDWEHRNAIQEFQTLN